MVEKSSLTHIGRAVVLLWACSLLLVRCDCDLTDAAGSLFIGPEDEERLGDQFHQSMQSDSGQQEFPFFRPDTPAETEFQNYVQGLFQEVVTAIPADETPVYGFTATIIDKDVQNAFAVPGGYVYIYTGIICSMQDESELVGVLAHEVAHVTEHHYRDQLVQRNGLAIVVSALLGDDPGKLAQVVGGSLFSLASLQLSRSDEEEADETGTRFLAKTGRNPQGIAKYFARVESQGPRWFSTHPPPDDRVENVNALVQSNPEWAALAANASTTNYTNRFLEKTAPVCPNR